MDSYISHHGHASKDIFKDGDDNWFIWSWKNILLLIRRHFLRTFCRTHSTNDRRKFSLFDGKMGLLPPSQRRLGERGDTECKRSWNARCNKQTSCPSIPSIRWSLLRLLCWCDFPYFLLESNPPYSWTSYDILACHQCTYMAPTLTLYSPNVLTMWFP